MTTHALTHDPLRAVHDALERHGCDPTGPVYKCTARCPAHEDRTPSLSVNEGADGRALVYCHAGCEAADIVAALGLQWQDLFPPGHHKARPIRMLAKPRAPVDLVLEALRELEIDYRCTRNREMWAADRCPACDGDLLLIQEDESRVRLCCFNGCDQTRVLAALLGEQVTS